MDITCFESEGRIPPAMETDMARVIESTWPFAKGRTGVANGLLVCSVVAVSLLGAGCSKPARAPTRSIRSDAVGGVDSAAQEAHVARVTASLSDPILLRGASVRRSTLAERMAEFHVPGLSVAVAEGGRLAWTRAYGVADANTGKAVTPRTLFQAASISKPIAATATLRIVQRGVLQLDQDVNRYLTSWHVPENEFTQREKVTLRRLMSHQAGTTGHGFLGIRQGAPVPTVVQVLNGEPPATSERVTVDMIPGSGMRYSGGGVLIEQLVTTDVMHEAYTELTRRLVLDPFGMLDSTFEQPLSPARRAAAALAHDAAGCDYEGNLLVYPEQAAAGLWTTPTDLVTWAIQLAEAARGRHPELLSPELASLMTHRLEAGSPAALGTFVWGEGKARYFWHGGRSEGYACELLYFPETGQGAAVMTNADTGGSLLRSLLNAIAAEYGWIDYGPQLVDEIRLEPGRLDRMLGTYSTTRPAAIRLQVTRQGESLFFESEKRGIHSAGIVTGPHEVTLTSEAMLTLAFTLDDRGHVSQFELGDFQLAKE